MEPLVYAIVLNYNNLEDTTDCLKSLENLNYKNYRILLVDNGSRKDIVQEIKNRFPNLEIIENKRNLGYAGGNNVGILKAIEHGADYIFLLNNDAIVCRDVLRNLVKVMEENNCVAACQPLICYFHEKDKIWSAGTKFSFGYPKLYLKNKAIEKIKLKVAFEPPFGLVGCAMLIRTSAIREVGLFDESLFLMHEETDWCIRAKKRGFKLLVVPNAIVYHKVSATLEVFSKSYLYYVSRNWLRVARKNFGWPKYLYTTFTELTIRFMYYTYQLLKRRQFGMIKYYLYGVRDGLLGLAGEAAL